MTVETAGREPGTFGAGLLNPYETPYWDGGRHDPGVGPVAFVAVGLWTAAGWLVGVVFGRDREPVWVHLATRPGHPALPAGPRRPELPPGPTEPAEPTARPTEPAELTARPTEPAELTAGPTEPAEPTAGPTEPPGGPAERTAGPAELTAGPAERTAGPAELTAGSAEPAEVPSKPTAGPAELPAGSAEPAAVGPAPAVPVAVSVAEDLAAAAVRIATAAPATGATVAAQLAATAVRIASAVPARPALALPAAQADPPKSTEDDPAAPGDLAPPAAAPAPAAPAATDVPEDDTEPQPQAESPTAADAARDDDEPHPRSGTPAGTAPARDDRAVEEPAGGGTLVVLPPPPTPAPAGVAAAVEAPAAREPRRFRPDVQGLRAVAVLLVVLGHAGVPGIRAGFVGVDVFFVISGYLITRQLDDEARNTGRISLRGFWARRIRRLLPPAVLVLVATLVFARLVLPPSQLLALTRDAVWAAGYGINYHLAADGVNYQNAAGTPSALQHYWSLALEEQFYLAWPLLLVAAGLVRPRRLRRPLLIGAIVAVCAVTLAYSLTVTPVNSSLAYFALHTRAWELGLGALVALGARQLGRVPGRVAAPASWLGLAAVLGSAVLYSDTTAYPGSAALLPVGGAALLLAAGVHRRERGAEALLRRGPLQHAGKVSYAWYLWHWPMLVLLPAWAGREFGWGGKLQIVALAYWLAILTYFLENASRRSTWQPRRWLPAGLTLSAGTAGVALLVATSMPTLVGTGEARAAGPLGTADVGAVQAALTDGMRIGALPRNLTPSLRQVADDRPASTADGCHAMLLETEPLRCVYGNPAGRRTLLLVGDSHAQQWLAALRPGATRAGWRLVTYTKAACPLADVTVWNNDLNRSYRECDRWRDAAYPLIRQLRPDVVVASQSDDVPWTSVTDAEWATRTVAALRELTGPGTRTVLVGDTPTARTDPLPCLEKHLDDATRCAFARSDAYPHFPRRHAAVRDAVTAAGLSHIDPTDLLCGAWCPAVVGNVVVRRDPGHLTDTYARWLAPMFTPLFADPTPPEKTR